MTRLIYPGFGFEIVNFPTYDAPVEGSENTQTITPQARKQAELVMDNIRENRGKFISGCVDIDNFLGQAISNFFFKNDSIKREMLHNFILDTTIFSLTQKKNVLQRIMEKFPKEFPSFSKKSRQKMFENINYLIKIRNSFAHGGIIIDFQSDKAFIRYFNSSTNQQAELDVSPDFFIELQNKILEVTYEIFLIIPEPQELTAICLRAK